MIKKPNLNNKKGFTIIELVVVVVILSLLALIMVPNMTSYKERTNKRRIQTEMAGVYTATKSTLDEVKSPGSMFENNRASEDFSNQLDDFTNLGSEKLGRYEFVVANGKLTLFYKEDGRWYVYDGAFNNPETKPTDYISIAKHYEDTTVSEIIPEPTVFLVQFLSEGDVKKTQIVRSGENATPPTLYREGYTFAGWDESYENIVSDTTIIAQWKDPYLATDEDFEWVPSAAGYTATNEPGTGYYQYTGGKTIVKIPHVINGNPMTSYYYMFFESTGVEKVISDNPNITDMWGMFSGSKATELDLSSFNTSNVTNMRFMFDSSQATELDLSSFNTSNVTDMSGMFSESWATTLNLSSFDTSNVTDMNRMFADSKATTLDLSSFKTSNVTDMWAMFSRSKATTITGLSSFDTSKVTDMRSMFAESQATSLDLSSFNTSSVTRMSDMFRYSQATTLDLSSFNTSNVTDMSFMFFRSQATTLDLSNFNTSNVTNMGYMFYNSQATTLDLSSFNTSNVNSMSDMFSESKATTGYARTSEDAERFNTSSGKPSNLNFVAPVNITIKDTSNYGSPNAKIHIIPIIKEFELESWEIQMGDVPEYRLSEIISLYGGDAITLPKHSTINMTMPKSKYFIITTDGFIMDTSVSLTNRSVPFQNFSYPTHETQIWGLSEDLKDGDIIDVSFTFD